MKKTIIVLVGLPGSGKTTAALFFKKNNIPVIRMGSVTERLLREKGKKITEKNEYQERMDLRKTEGDDVYARLTLPHVEAFLKKGNTVVIEGMMSLSEKEYFENKLGQIKIVYIESPKKIRFNRLEKRELRPLNLLEAEKRDRYEIDKLGKINLKKDADAVVTNEGGMEEFYGKLEEVLDNHF